MVVGRRTFPKLTKSPPFLFQIDPSSEARLT
jgi:hypothetical protein